METDLFVENEADQLPFLNSPSSPPLNHQFSASLLSDQRSPGMLSPHVLNNSLDDNNLISEKGHNAISSRPKTPEWQWLDKFAQVFTTRKVQNGVNLDVISTERPYAQIESSIEFLLITLSKALDIQPKQAIEFLWDENKTLISLCVKGVKTTAFEPVLQWYRHLADEESELSTLLILEVLQLKDAGKNSFFKALSAMASGFYSNNFAVVKACFELFAILIKVFIHDPTVHEMFMRWFFDQEGVEEGQKCGFLTMQVATFSHNETTEQLVDLCNLLANSEELLIRIYQDELMHLSPSVSSYIFILTDFYDHLLKTKRNEIASSGLIEFWMDLSAREAEDDGSQLVEERIAALNLLADIWLSMPVFVDSHQELGSLVLFMLKRGVCDRQKLIKVTSIVLVFQLLDEFLVASRNITAISEMLSQCLVENLIDPTVRDLLFKNLTAIFTKHSDFNVDIILEPILKQFNLNLGVSIVVKGFDIGFFHHLSLLSSLTPKNAYQLVLLLQRVLFFDFSFANMCIPLIIRIVQRYLNRSALPEGQEMVYFLHTYFDETMQQIVMIDEHLIQAQQQISTFAVRFNRNKNKEIQQRLSSVKNSNQNTITLQLTPHTGSRSGKPSEETLKQREFEHALRLQRQLFMDILTRLQAMITDVTQSESPDVSKEQLDQLSRFIKDQAIAYFLRIHENFPNQFSKAMIVVFSFYGITAEGVFKRRKTSAKRASSINNSVQKNSVQSTKVSLPELNVASYGESEAAENQLVLYEQDQKGGHAAKKQAKEYINKLRRQKIEKEFASQQREEKSKQAAERKKIRLASQIQQRKVELGIADRGTIVNELALITTDVGTPQKSFKVGLSKKILTFHDMELVEDRDREAMDEYFKKYTKLWRNIFAKYRNQGFKPKNFNAISFDQLTQNVQQLSLADVNKILKEHAMLPLLVSQLEVQQIVRMVNTRKDLVTLDPGQEITQLNYDGFVQFLIQVAVHAFSGPPRDLSNLPYVESLKAMIATFEQATRDRGQHTLLFDNYDNSQLSKKEQELLQSLTAKLQEDPEVPLPEGVTRIKERIVVCDYSIPKNVHPYLGDAKVVSATLLDDVVNELFGIHFLEPNVTFKEVFKARFILSRPRLEPSSLPTRKKLKPIPDRTLQTPSEDDISQPATTKNSDSPSFKNQILQNRREQAAKEAEEKKILDEKRKQRARQLQDEIQKRKEEVEQKAAELKELDEAKKRKQQERNNRLAEARRQQQLEQKEKLAQHKQQAEEERQNRLAEELAEKKEALERRKREKKEFFTKQNEQLGSKFETIKQERESVKQQQVEKAKKDQDTKVKLKTTVVKQIKGSVQFRVYEKQQNSLFAAFLEREHIVAVFAEYEPGLLKYFDFYCNQQTVVLGFDLPFRQANLHFKEFVKLGAKSKLVPTLVTSDELIKIFRNTTRHNYAMSSNNSHASLSGLRSSGSQKDLKLEEVGKENTQFISLLGFKVALVKIAMIGFEVLSNLTSMEIEALQKGDRLKSLSNVDRGRSRTIQNNEEANVLSQMRAEFESIKKDYNEEDFQNFVKKEEKAGRGVTQRVLQLQHARRSSLSNEEVSQRSKSRGNSMKGRSETSKTRNLSLQRQKREADLENVTDNTLKTLFQMLGIPSGDDLKALEARLRSGKEPSKLSTPLKVKLKANNNRKSRTNQKLAGLETIKEQDDMTKRIDEFKRIETADATDLKVVEKNIRTARTEDAQPVDSNRSGEQQLEHEVTKENNVS